MTEKFIQLLNEMLAQNGPMLKGVSAKTVAEYKNMVEQNEVDPDRFYLVYDENADESTGTVVLVNGKSVYIFDADTKQDKEDEGLETVAKNIVDAINEVRRSIPSLAGLASEAYAEQKAAEKAGEALQSAKAYMDKAIVEEVAKIVAGADASFDTLKEIADWIKSHPESVAEINALIQANAEKILLNETAIENVRTLLQEMQESFVKVSDGDAFVKSALTNLTLANDEKTSVCNAIGALPKPAGQPTGAALLQVFYNPAALTTTYSYVNVGLASGNIAAYQNNTTDLSVIYGNGTTLYVDTPKGTKQVANKAYVDNVFAARRKVYKLSEFITELGQGKFTDGALVVFTMLPREYPVLRVENTPSSHSVLHQYISINQGAYYEYNFVCGAAYCKLTYTVYSNPNLESTSPITIEDYLSTRPNSEVYVYD